MAKYEERKVPLGDPAYGAPEVTVRRVDLAFGKIPLSDARLRPYLALDRRVVKVHSDEPAEVIVHCVDHVGAGGRLYVGILLDQRTSRSNSPFRAPSRKARNSDGV